MYRSRKYPFKIAFITTENSLNFLGVILDEHLTWKKYI